MSRGRLPPGLDHVSNVARPEVARVLVLDGGRGTAGHLSALGHAVTAFDLATFDRLPFEDAAFDAVVLLDVLAHVADDQGTIDEAARVLRPGGTLIVRVPYRGLLGWLDADNLGRYLGEVTGRGPRPSEADVLGWRRHYRRRELQAMLGPARFRPLAVVGTGLALADGTRLLSTILFRLLWRHDALWRLGGVAADTIARVEDHLTVGFLAANLTLIAERRPHDARPT